MESAEGLFEIRRSSLTDVKQIENLRIIFNSTEFGKISLVKLIERSVLSLCVTDSDKNLIGHACFYEYPNSLKFPENDWDTHFRHIYCTDNITTTNSLFIHLLAVSPVHDKFAITQLLKMAFTVACSVHYIFFVLGDACSIKCLNSFPFHTLSKRVAEGNDVFCAYRHEIFPVLFCRPAAVEDTDDLTPLINDQSKLLQKTYGDYYVSELVEAQNDNLKCVVVEYDRRAVGFVSATRDLNLRDLNAHYDLDLFSGLAKFDKSVKKEAEEQNEFPMTVTESTLEVTDKTENTLTISSYIKIEERINPSDLNQSSYLLNNEDNSQVCHWTKRLLHKDYDAQNSNKIKLTDNTKLNAFGIQIFTMKPEYESRFMDMLPLLFSQFSDLEYAVITVPRLVKCFPMLKSFVHCRIRQNKDPEHELYVLHRCELHRDFTVRRTRHADEEDIKLLIRNMNAFDRSLFLSDLQSFISNGRDEDGTIIFSYVAIALGKLVGVAILRDEHHIEWLRAHYNIEDFIYFTHHARNEHVSLYHFLLAANFQSRTELFLREILRLSKKTCIYYRVLPPYAEESKFNRCTLITCLSKLSLVKPRKQIIYPESLLNNIKGPEKRILEKFNSMPSLFMTTKKLLMEPKELINARIIIVGASTTGLAILEKLITCTYIRFTNLVLLSPNGLPGDTLERVNPLAYKFLSTDYAYPVDYLSQLGFKVCVNVICGKLTAIDRKFKRITISSKHKLSYDYLIITTGLQYHVSCPMSKLENLTKEGTINNFISMNFDYKHDNDNNNCDNDNGNRYDTNNAICNMKHRFAILQSKTSRPRNLFVINDVHDVLPIIDRINNIYLPLFHEVQFITSENRTPSFEIKSSNADKQLSNENDQISEEKRISQQNSMKKQEQCEHSETEEQLKSQSNQLLYDTFNNLNVLDNERIVNKLFIIYGYTIDAYTCITGLLNSGVDGNCIIMIQPPKMKHCPPAFDSFVIQRKIHNHMNKLKIRIGYDFILDHWCNSNMESSSSDIKTVTFNSNGKLLTIPCLGLFYFHMKTVDVDVFKALNDSCIVFDSRLVIDIHFRTNDSSIFAAGPITKLKRIYYNDYWRHEIANSVEIGHCLGDQLLNLFDPNIENVKAPPVDDSFILPTFKQSKTVGTLLPGNLFYLHCTQPSLWESMDTRMNNSEFGRLLVTGEDAKEIRYFSIYINKYNLIQDITCLSTKEFPAENYIQLFNLHEFLLNHLVSRFDEGLIRDFYDYFNDTWSLAIYHDRFADFKSEIRNLINTCSPTTTDESLEAKLRTIIKEKDQVSLNDFQELNRLYNSEYKKEIEQRFIKFIMFNYNLLSMYAKPDLV
ncbi:unnamed protein product [Schistosoma mattheei]|uniref:Cilia- and flagella-associated protein 61 N-terminal domain-containing protein n=1 Tax=Schistosoma mattheei TaxID=31246 RepID=A0AA85BFK8_9TREM|nr:unnamed protein product [Schistosoma mattheei]